MEENSVNQYKIYKVLFIDMDGTLIETKSGETFGVDMEDWKFKKGILSKLYEVVDNFDIIHIVTNQGGADLGYFRPEDIKNKVDKIAENLSYVVHGKVDIKYTIAYTYNSVYRKPNADWVPSNSIK